MHNNQGRQEKKNLDETAKEQKETGPTFLTGGCQGGAVPLDGR